MLPLKEWQNSLHTAHKIATQSSSRAATLLQEAFATTKDETGTMTCRH
jgi:hypothetical protein